MKKNTFGLFLELVGLIFVIIFGIIVVLLVIKPEAIESHLLSALFFVSAPFLLLISFSAFLVFLAVELLFVFLQILSTIPEA